MTKLKIGVLREEKNPPDKRVPLTPLICSELISKYPHIEIYIQPSKNRCYSDDEYSAFGLNLREDLSECDVLMGVKEVPVEKDRKSTRLNSSHSQQSRMPSSA